MNIDMKNVVSSTSNRLHGFRVIIKRISLHLRQGRDDSKWFVSLTSSFSVGSESSWTETLSLSISNWDTKMLTVSISSPTWMFLCSRSLSVDMKVLESGSIFFQFCCSISIGKIHSNDVFVDRIQEIETIVVNRQSLRFTYSTSSSKNSSSVSSFSVNCFNDSIMWVTLREVNSLVVQVQSNWLNLMKRFLDEDCCVGSIQVYFCNLHGDSYSSVIQPIKFSFERVKCHELGSGDSILCPIIS